MKEYQHSIEQIVKFIERKKKQYEKAFIANEKRSVEVERKTKSQNKAKH